MTNSFDTIINVISDIKILSKILFYSKTFFLDNKINISISFKMYIFCTLLK